MYRQRACTGNARVQAAVAAPAPFACALLYPSGPQEPLRLLALKSHVSVMSLLCARTPSCLVPLSKCKKRVELSLYNSTVTVAQCTATQVTISGVAKWQSSKQRCDGTIRSGNPRDSATALSSTRLCQQASAQEVCTASQCTAGQPLSSLTQAARQACRPPPPPPPAAAAAARAPAAAPRRRRAAPSARAVAGCLKRQPPS